MSTLETTSVIYVANHIDHVAARAAIVTTAVTQLRRTGVTRLVLEAREGQDDRDRSVIHRALRPDPTPPLSYTHLRPSNEPLLWVPDAVAWAWGRGGHWRQRVEDLGLVGDVETVIFD